MIEWIRLLPIEVEVKVVFFFFGGIIIPVSAVGIAMEIVDFLRRRK